MTRYTSFLAGFSTFVAPLLVFSSCGGESSDEGTKATAATSSADSTTSGTPTSGAPLGNGSGGVPGNGVPGNDLPNNNTPSGTPTSTDIPASGTPGVPTSSTPTSTPVNGSPVGGDENGGASGAGIGGVGNTAGMGGSSAEGGANNGGTGGADEGGAGDGGASAGAGGAGEPDASSDLSAGCGTEPGIASNMYNNGNPIPISAAGRDRRYILSVPEDYDNTKPYNLVIAWHQLDGNDKQMYDQNFYWIKDIPEAASSTIFVAPNGEKNGQPCTGMSVAEGGCGWPDSDGSNVALADAVVAEVEANFCIDKKRIFANGWSYGGSMSYRTACSRPLDGDEADWGVRAVAVYNGAAQLSSGGCTPSKSVAFYASHGTNDGVLGYDGGVSMATTYAQLNGCTAMTPTRATGDHVCTNYMGCMADYPVEFCSFVGQHTPDPPREGGDRWQP